MRYANRIARPVAIVLSLFVLVVVAIAWFGRSRPPAGQCGGTTGPATVGEPYALTLQVDGARVVSGVDFDGRIWRAVGDRVALSGLAHPGATAFPGAITLVNAQEAVFSSPAAYATLLAETRADGCPSSGVVRSGVAVGRG